MSNPDPKIELIFDCVLKEIRRWAAVDTSLNKLGAHSISEMKIAVINRVSSENNLFEEIEEIEI